MSSYSLNVGAVDVYPVNGGRVFIPVVTAIAQFRAQLAQTATDFGTDFDFFSDLNPRLPLVSGLSVLGQDIAHRLSTPRGGLFYDPDYGTDLRVYLSAPWTPQIQGACVSDATAEILKDERVLDASVTPAFDFSSETLSLAISATTNAGPFALILAVTDVTVALLSTNPS